MRKSSKHKLSLNTNESNYKVFFKTIQKNLYVSMMDKTNYQ